MEKRKNNEDPIKAYQDNYLTRIKWLNFFKSYWKIWVFLGIGMIIGWFLGFQEGFKKGVYDGFTQTMQLYTCFKK